jgi:hypothetical protein
MIVSPRCTSCRHSNLPDSATCTAYPKGIPDAILQKGFDHKNPYPGDHGIRYEPKPELLMGQAETPVLQKAS